MSNLFFALMMFFMIAAMISFVAIIIPFSRLFPNRKRALLIHLGCWLGMFVSAGFGASMDPKVQQDMAIKRKADEQMAARDAIISQQAAKQEQKSQAQALEREINQLWKGVLAAVSPCDDASKNVASSFARSSNPYQLYPIISEAQSTCRAASMALKDLDPPAGASSEVRGELETALNECRTAYDMRSYALGLVLDVVDGENRPSDVQEAVEAMQAGNQAPLRCVASFVTALGKSGLSDEAALKVLETK